MMKFAGIALFCLLGSLMASWGAETMVADANTGNPYHAIVIRNVFNLHDPPPPPAPVDNKPPPPKITPTGITDILGPIKVLFKVQLPAAPPTPAKEQSFIMGIGERQGEIEVLEIDKQAGSIKFNNYGTVVTLSLEKDGAKPPSGPAPAPAVAGVPAAPVPTSNFTQPVPPSANTARPMNTAMNPIPTRQIRTPSSTTGPGGYPAPPGGYAAPGFGTPNAQPQPSGPQPTASHEEQIIMMEVEREVNKNNPNYPPLPPTPLSPGGTRGSAPPPPGPGP